MLSHLRFHRRGPASNPTSPSPDQNPTSPTAGHPASPFSPDALSPDLRPASSNPSALPPTLPPIDRVTTGDFGNSRDSRQYATTTSPINTRPQPASKTSSFIGGVALRKYQRDIEAQATEAPDNTRPGLVQQSASQPALTSNNLPLRPSPQFLRNTRATSSFSTPTEFQNSAAPTGRRPAGTRLTTELPSLTQTTSNTENPKAKKGLPFLKKPMSTLLMRRKNSQHAPDLRPLPLTKQREDPIYDPRIMGTRVHDFSAPRPKKNNTPSRENTQPSLPSPVPNSAPLPTQDRFLNPPDTRIDQTPLSASALTRREPSNASESIYSQDSRTLRMTPSTASAGVHAPIGDLDALVLSDAPPVPPKDDSPISVQPRSPQASRLIDEDAYIHERSSSSFRTGRSRGPSLSGLSGKDIASAIPRHMKSTSSRFSFDMVGAAKQEKLLEDRHRQRELEKKTAEVPAARDSRFDDDFDDDGFDYDAMMEDDGFEEEIPMVGDDFDDMDDGFNNGLNDDFNDYNINNMSSSKHLDAHLDNNMNNTLNRTMDDEPDEDFDPDNDQENFSGFVFQRSGPTSALTSPHSAGLLPTPRDAEGNRIGYAMSQYTPNMFASLSPSHPPDQRASQEMQAGGLGIQGLDVLRVPSLENEAAFQKNRELPPIDTGRTLNDDELYYDDGILEFERNEFAEDLAAPPEWDDTPFDESIFDNNDTDQFGRPIAGAFAQAQSQSLNRSGNQDETNRVSDTTAPFSAGSETSKTTAHTSLSAVEKQVDEPGAPQDSLVTESSPEPSVVPLSSSPQDGDDSAAYQAALVAATFQAAASGKFQRGSSPPPDDSILSEQNRSPNSPDQDNSFRQDDYESFDDYGDYNDSYENMAEFELDDDAIIAEANADALANDCDGWYGQEFGFYSAAAGQQQTPDFEYANGGFFGPKGGLDRSASGRMISREPNLTPITERSEYSNRNSFMSLGMPSFGGTTPLQSPGLAQLALLGDRGDEMTLSALLRLRSRAWGGSQASLASSQNGSPREERGDLPMSPWGQSIMSPTTFHTRKNSVLSTISHESDSVSASGSPTLTGGIPGLMLSPPPVPSLAKLETGVKEGAQVAPLNVSRPTSRTFDKPISPISDSEESMPPSAMVSPLEPSNRASMASMAESSSSPKRPGIGHRHKGSADSISYTKEEDSGATRWVMERRRTGESGQVEILEREVLEGGRI